MTSVGLSPLQNRPIDLQRWPGLAAPKAAPVRAALARVFLQRAAVQARIRFETSDGRHFGPADGPVVLLCDPGAFFTRLGRDGKIGFGESYMAGEWRSPDLVAVLEALACKADSLVPRPLQVFRRWFDARQPTDEDNDRRGAVRNVVRHYDLSNELFATFLDESMTYSAALFTDEHTTLAQAQIHKIERLLDAVGVQQGSRVLEIGTGWGELALRAARRGADVVTLTLSNEQAALARRRVAAEGLDGRVEVRLQDYRDATGTYDAIVSVEMVEAVGERWWPSYFRTLDRCLASGGRVGLQAITMAHDRLLATKASWTWIHKYIFPGGLVPSEWAIEKTLADCTSLVIVDRLAFGQSYARTLACWQEQFVAAGVDVQRMGFDETFERMWSFYLAYCEAGFRSEYLDVVQLVLSR